jgi:hypothetical protein
MARTTATKSGNTTELAIASTLNPIAAAMHMPTKPHASRPPRTTKRAAARAGSGAAIGEALTPAAMVIAPAWPQRGRAS